MKELSIAEINNLESGTVHVTEQNGAWNGACQVSVKDYHNGKMRMISLTPLAPISGGHGYSFWRGDFQKEDRNWLTISQN